MTTRTYIPEDILQAAREGLCWDACEATRKGVVCEGEKDCCGFFDFAKEIMDEEKSQAASDTTETHRRLTRDMVEDWRRANR